jgi:hypothetical protein
VFSVNRIEFYGDSAKQPLQFDDYVDQNHVSEKSSHDEAEEQELIFKLIQRLQVPFVTDLL